MVTPHAACSNPDGTASAYICEGQDAAVYSHGLAPLSRVGAKEVVEDRYEEIGIETQYYLIGQERLQATWSYAEYGIQGPSRLVSRLVEALLRALG